MQEIKSIGVLSAAFMGGVVYFILGEFGALIFAAVAMTHGHGGQGNVVFILLALPYAILGAIFVAISACVYTLVARWIGGIKLELATRIEEP